MGLDKNTLNKIIILDEHSSQILFEKILGKLQKML